MPIWTNVSKLSVVLESGEQSCDVYANGQNMIGVTIDITPVDEHGKSIEVDPKDLVANLWLVDYVDGTKLNWRGSTGWGYTDVANDFVAVPGRSGERPGTSTADQGAQQVKFYVYCQPGANPKSIGVRVVTDAGNTVTSSQDGSFHSKVALTPRAAVTYMLGDITWNYSRATTQFGDDTTDVTTDAWNYYLSLNVPGNYFVTFRVHGHYSDDGYDGLVAYSIPSGRDDFYGAYIWYQEPHDSAYYSEDDGGSLGQIVDFPEGNLWSDWAWIYDREYPGRYLCCTWVHATTGGDGWVIPNGPLTAWSAWFTSRIVAWDRYGNKGTFWLKGSDITSALKLYDHVP
ncbi:hypothetical protein SAMN05216371_0514 [Streptomyces sp. TLI_053]|uniref:hypothetical protein n=1 Tax=Streptomyces sp. TLI_053 TaxID=1855352 RepID=UPI00087AC581|nr:hypothetical protein [Streptomyces sp. TLI_053]SDS73787.1 hypothetical protein SAMN05216371_0514 [Streptomyces sp. TLI_053]